MTGSWGKGSEAGREGDPLSSYRKLGESLGLPQVAELEGMKQQGWLLSQHSWIFEKLGGPS